MKNKPVTLSLRGSEHKDLRALRDACRAMESHTSRKMMLATLDFLHSKYVEGGWEPKKAVKP